MEKFIKYLVDNIITTVFVVGTFLGLFMGWIFTKDYYQKNVIAEKQEYMEKALEIYESEYGCL